MIETNEWIIKHKASLLNLTAEQGNVSKACKVTSLSHDTFYRYKVDMESGGIEALLDRTRRKPI